MAFTGNQKGITKAQARKLLTAADRKALPFLGKKYNNPGAPDDGMWQEDRLVKAIVERMKIADGERKMRIQRCQDVDIQLSGYVALEKEDKKNDKNNKRGKAPKPVKHNLSLAYSQIDDLVTYLMSVYAPEMNIFVATSTAQKQAVAEGLTREIGRQGQTLKYYREMAKMCLNAIKYNFGGLTVNWEQQQGTVFQADASTPGQLKKADGVLWQGNVLKSIDAYNFLYDTSVHPCDLSLHGEYFAEIQPVTPFRVRRMADEKILFGIERFVNTVAPPYGSSGSTFYVQPPSVRDAADVQASGNGGINWQRILSAGSTAKESILGIELAWFTWWVKPNDYSVSDSDSLELWRFCLANGQYIASAVKVEDSHGQLPCGISAPIEDDLQNNQRTYAEQLLPLQIFASFLLNTHVDATRKAIYGITVFDSNLFPGLDLDTDDLIGARIAMKSSATGIDIDKAFRHYDDAPNTDQNVDMVGKIVDLMQKILPTNSLQQVADLERATEYQAAATVQAGSRRNLKIARIINDQCISVVKFQMLYNIYAKLPSIEFVDQNGATQQITPAQLLEAAIEFDVGTGLKGLDRLMQVSIFKECMSYLFQMKDIGQQVDVLGLLSYVTQLAGFESDLSQFKIQQPPAGTAPPANANAPQPPAPAQTAAE